MTKKLTFLGIETSCDETAASIIRENDIAVHSLKDMETKEDDRLTIGAFIKRNDFRDVIISNKIKSLKDLQRKIVIGSSSRRRELQLKKINKNIYIKYERKYRYEDKKT